MSDKKMKPFGRVSTWIGQYQMFGINKNKEYPSKFILPANIYHESDVDTLQSERDQYKEQRDIAIGLLNHLKEKGEKYINKSFSDCDGNSDDMMYGGYDVATGAIAQKCIEALEAIDQVGK